MDGHQFEENINGIAQLHLARAKPAPSEHSMSSSSLYKESEPDASNIPEEVLSQAFALLPQRQRVTVSLVCKRWAGISRTSRLMWRSLRLELRLFAPSAAEASESFVHWFIPRAPQVTSLTIIGRRVEHPAVQQAPLESIVMSNVATALAVAGPYLQELSMDWSGDLILSSWIAPLTALRIASFSSTKIVVRQGLGMLPSLLDLRLRSSGVALTLSNTDSADRGPALLPPGLKALRIDGCHLMYLPSAVASLRHLTDLVLSNNALAPADLTPLSSMTCLRQLTLMGTRMPHVPPVLSHLTSLRVLYLDWTVNAAPAQGFGPPTHQQLSNALGPLRRLGVLSLGSCQLERFPQDLIPLTSLRALYLDNNPFLDTLPPGPYLQQLRVLGMDWRVLFGSYTVLKAARCLEKLCLTSIGGVEGGPHAGLEADVMVVLSALPRLRQVLLPMVEGNRAQLFVDPLNVALRLAALKGVTVKAATYGGINNEWIEWLEAVDGM